MLISILIFALVLLGLCQAQETGKYIAPIIIHIVIIAKWWIQEFGFQVSVTFRYVEMRMSWPLHAVHT